MNAGMPTPEGVVRNPAGPLLIGLSVLTAFCFNLLPWQGIALLARPDFLLLALIYWCIEEPRHVGATTAFAGGLLMDVAESSFVGQNALVYSLAAYLAVTFRGRILRFGWGAGALHVFGILLLCHALFALEHLMLATPFPGREYFLRAPFGALLWVPLCWLLEQPRMQPRKDEVA